MVKSLAEVSASRVTARHPECGSMSNLASRCDPQTGAVHVRQHPERLSLSRLDVDVRRPASRCNSTLIEISLKSRRARGSRVALR
jgi:hypothetical protein